MIENSSKSPKREKAGRSVVKYIFARHTPTFSYLQLSRNYKKDVRQRSGDLWTSFGESSGNGRKSSENRQKRGHHDADKIKPKMSFYYPTALRRVQITL